MLSKSLAPFQASMDIFDFTEYQISNLSASFGRPANTPLIGVGFDYNPKFTFDVSDSKTEQDNTSGLRVRLPFFVLSAVWPVHTTQSRRWWMLIFSIDVDVIWPNR